MKKYHTCLLNALKPAVFGVVGSFSSALGIHFKIDLPSQEGVVPSETYSSGILDLEKDFILPPEENLELGNSDSKSLPQNSIQEQDLNLTPKNPQIGVKKKKSSGDAFPKKLEIGSEIDLPKMESSSATSLSVAFPTPKCLSKNVDFWANVYTKWDANDVVLHDKTDLSRVFGVYAVSGTNRNLLLNEIKTNTQNQLKEIADKLEFGLTLQESEKKVLAKFSDSQTNPAKLRAAADSLRFQSGLKTQFYQGVLRSLKYLPTVQSILKEEKMPSDIAFLPHVESSYNPGARSKVGASGMWQIMPGTMTQLMGRGTIHRRNETDFSTRAAVKLLKMNMAELGSWPLALTAYNHGLNGMNRAVKSVGSKDFCDIIDRYESNSFKFASSNFYAQFLAARNESIKKYQMLAKDKKHEGVVRHLMAAVNRKEN